jgi:soluble lytic murein transglycosylase-like protein
VSREPREPGAQSLRVGALSLRVGGPGVRLWNGGCRRAAFSLLLTLVAVPALLLAGCTDRFTLAPGPDEVPAALVPLFRRAAATYGGVTPAQLAAQARVESKFDARAVSAAGAQGLMQFLPATWRQFGTDGNRDGRADPLDPHDAIVSAARYDAYLATLVRHLPGDRLSLVLAAYNAGPAAVRGAGGIPDIPETRAYVRRVNAWARQYDGQL